MVVDNTYDTLQMPRIQVDSATDGLASNGEAADNSSMVEHRAYPGHNEVGILNSLEVVAG
jgi:hypothetical protein